MQLLELRLDRQEVLTDLLKALAACAPGEDGSAPRTLQLSHQLLNDDGYAAAWLDMLILSGVAQLESDTQLIHVPDMLSRYLLLLLADLLGPEALRADNRDEIEHLLGETLYRSLTPTVEHLTALETYRLRLLPNAKPLRHVEAAVAVILDLDRHTRERRYLLDYDQRANEWQFPGGRCEITDRSWRDTLLRELGEELVIPNIHEFLHVVYWELGTPFTEQRLSPTYGLLTETTFQLFGARLTRRLPRMPPTLRWCSEKELLDGHTSSGETINAVPLLHVLREHKVELDMLIQG